MRTLELTGMPDDVLARLEELARRESTTLETLVLRELTEIARRSSPARGTTFRTPQLVLFTHDLPRAVAFYRRLGFTEAFRTPAQGDPIHVDLVLDGYRIGLATVASVRSDHGLDPVGAGQRAAVVLWCDDTAAGLRALLEAGATKLADPHVWLDRLLIAWASDPDGHPIQVVQQL